MDEALSKSMGLLSKLYNPEPPANDLLYHYTDFSGLQGILVSRRLRATYSRVLNDPSEETHARNELRKALARIDPLLVSDDISFGERRTFIACFCESDELLTMWRAYAGDGGGFCLGFRYSGLKNSMCWEDMANGEWFPLLAQVHYGRTPKSIDAYLKSVFKRPMSREVLSQLPLPPFLPGMIKHKAFREEHEWRIIALDPPTRLLQFRPGRGVIKPFVELACVHLGQPLEQLPLATITVGPTLSPEKHTEEILRWMLEKHGYESVAVKRSAIPYRP